MLDVAELHALELVNNSVKSAVLLAPLIVISFLLAQSNNAVAHEAPDCMDEDIIPNSV